MYNVDKLRLWLVPLLLLEKCVIAYEIPDVTIQAWNPRGLSVSVPDAPGITSVDFSGTVRGETYEAEGTEATQGRWTLRLPNLELNNGDVVDYMLFVTLNHGDTYLKDGLRYTVQGKETAAPPPGPPLPTTSTPRPTTQAYYVPPATVAPPPTDPPPTNPPPPTSTACPRSATTVRGQGNFCAGDVIFEDTFNKLDENIWRIEHKIPSDHPEYPFVTYQRSQVRIARFNRQRMLLIEPKILNANQITGSINLGPNCTGRHEECQYQASGPDIVRPVVSGRVTTKTFAFKFGRVDVQAKLPQGDWLYPELLLEEFSPWSPFNGIMKIASARGNKNLQDDSGNEFGSELLYGILSYSPQCKARVFSEVIRRAEPQWTTWHDEFHVYSLVWAPTGITFLVDGQIMGSKRTPPFQGAKECDARKRSTEMSPFDRDYKLSFGVAAGGIWVFEDELKTVLDGYKLRDKPWRNLERKAMLNFFKAQKHWLPTWEDTSKLIISHVRVTAL